MAITASAWTGMGFKIKKIDTRFNFGPNFWFNRNADVFNNAVNYSRSNYNLGFNMGIKVEGEEIRFQHQR